MVAPPIMNPIRADMSDYFEKESGVYPPLGLMYLAAYLKQNSSHQVEILDCPDEKITPEEIENKVRGFQPDLVGITTLTFTLLDVLVVAQRIKSLDPNIHICLGGSHPFLFPQETISFPFVDSLVLGEGENTFLGLIDCLGKKSDWKEIKGLVWKDKSGEVNNTDMADLNPDPDSFPFPDRRATPYKRYFSVMSKGSLMTTMITSRGCPYSCIFCGRPHLGKKFRARSPQNVVAELRECLGLGIKEFMIFDDIFTLDRQRVLAICNLIIEQGLNISYAIRSRVDTVDKYVLEALKKSGCQRISYGIESGNDNILKNLKKGITKKQALEAVKMTRDLGITVLADFMLGSPGEKRDHILETIDFALALNPDFAQFTITTPFPGTELYEKGLGLGLLKEDYWQKFAQDPSPNFITPVWEENLSREELLELFQLAHKRFYLRPRYIFKRLYKTTSLKELTGAIKAGKKVFSLSREKVKNL